MELHHAGWTGRAIAAALGVVPSAVSNWLKQVRAGGPAALRARRHQTGKRPKLSHEQHQRLLGLLTSGAETQGEIGERWTGKRVAALIKREFGIVYHPEYIPRLLRALGWTPQKPVKVARANAMRRRLSSSRWTATRLKRGARGRPNDRLGR